MAPEELPLRCLSVCVRQSSDSEIDLLELAHYLNDVAGKREWISASDWLFTDAPAATSGHVTLPVVTTDDTAVRVIVSDLGAVEQRIIYDHAVTGAEARRWRWLAFQNNPNSQGKGFFPWEIARG